MALSVNDVVAALDGEVFEFYPETQVVVVRTFVASGVVDEDRYPVGVVAGFSAEDVLTWLRNVTRAKRAYRRACF
jgi:hypothetical protein